VDPDSNTLVAVLVAACATLVVGIAAGVTLLSIRVRTGASRAGLRMREQASEVRRDAPGLRVRIERAADRVDRLRQQWAATDQAVTDVADTLASARGSLEGLTRGRLALFVRGAGIVSKAAQVALLWR
jgi:hypothetical protein